MKITNLFFFSPLGRRIPFDCETFVEQLVSFFGSQWVLNVRMIPLRSERSALYFIDLRVAGKTQPAIWARSALPPE